MQNIWQKSTNI